VNYKNAYFIPSHRILKDENLVDFSNEVYFALKEKGSSIPFILLDDTDENINRDKISSIKQEFQENEYFVVNKKHIKLIYDEISKALEDEHKEVFQSVYPDNVVNYGNTLNKMFILGAVMHCEAFHRRDSDILMDTIGTTSQKVYPIGVELDYLGSKVEGKTVYIVGSGYNGMRNIDFGEIIGNDIGLYKEYLDCLNMPEEYQAEKILDFKKENDEPYVEDGISLNGSPECGNVSFYKIFEYIPCSPVPYTLGTDYFTKEIVNQANLALVYHKRNVIHKHTKCRYDSHLKVFNYIKGIASFVDTMCFYSDFFPNMQNEMIQNKCFENKLQELNDTLVGYYSVKIDSLDTHTGIRRQSFKRFIALLKKSKNQQFSDAADELMDQQEEIFRHTNDLLTKHVALIKAWPYIMQAAKKAGDTSQVHDILQTAKIV